ncbi:glycerophosphodiester phosphodiesterase [Streptomyces xiaopingdaonensis]|uniref:glycerophosphodiester phosphodiesterase n=1 Tax=Streptomyces xiaopingdaonensis TaxID=1565415 RepID=UPI0002F7D6E5|nr:glycerophosphodiester phosphodiesterase family protein [Streptomyces xiaopingdaonensis]
MPLLTVGHRGVMGVEPENTLRSFVRADREKLDYIELDLHLSKDGELVVMHDPAVDRTTDGSGAIGELTLEELRTLDAGQGERVPVFDEVVDAVQAPIQAEIKDRAAARVLCAAIEARKLHDRITVISFHDDALAETAQLLPEQPLVVVAGKSSPRAPERAAALGAGMASLELGRFDGETVRRCQEAGVRVISWTVNTPEELEQAVALGLDGIVTDRPETARAASAR